MPMQWSEWAGNVFIQEEKKSSDLYELPAVVTAVILLLRQMIIWELNDMTLSEGETYIKGPQLA